MSGLLNAPVLPPPLPTLSKRKNSKFKFGLVSRGVLEGRLERRYQIVRRGRPLAVTELPGGGTNPPWPPDLVSYSMIWMGQASDLRIGRRGGVVSQVS